MQCLRSAIDEVEPFPSLVPHEALAPSKRERTDPFDVHSGTTVAESRRRPGWSNAWLSSLPGRVLGGTTRVTQCGEGVSEGHPLVPIRVLIVDDSEVVASSLERVLAREADIEVVGVARTERDALSIAADEMTDVLVMDYRLGEADGIRAAERVRRVQPAVRVVLLSGDVTDSY